MKRTTQFQIPYFEVNDYTSAEYDLQRFETLDAQLSALYSLIGNGILSGWDIIASSGFSVVITAGSGNVAFVSVETTDNTTLSGLTPSTTNYIYAQINADSYWTQSVSFTSFVSLSSNSDVLYLGYVVTDANGVTSVNMDSRDVLGFVGLVQDAVKAHRHIGGTTNPTQVDLSTDVKGVLGDDNIPPLDTSKITTGTLDPSRLPLIDHLTKVANVGSLTHSQIDSFIETLSIDSKVMGEVSTSNLLQLILALKHIYPNIDDSLVNELAFIPGISPNDYIDTINTTAIVDTRTYAEGGQHTITGASGTGFKAYTRIWNTEDDFDAGEINDVVVTGDAVSLEPTLNTYVFDEFSDLSTWNVTTEDLSAIPSFLTKDDTQYVTDPPSAKLTVGSENVEIILLVKKKFTAQDWSGYNYFQFYIKETDVEHGDIYFYIKDNFYGEQNSYTKILDRNAPTVNVDTLENGWQKITLDITKYIRTNINEIGFYVSTQKGWDTSKGFGFNIDDMRLLSGNIYETDGYIRLIYGSDFYYDFWRLRWDAIIPSDSESVGVVLKARTRVANSISDLPLAPWTIYYSTSGYDIPIPPSILYKYIEIEFFFGASTSLKRSATLKKVYLDFYATDVDNSFEFSTKQDWESGHLYNIDTQTTPNSMLISGIDEIGDTYYGTNQSAYQLDPTFQELYKVTGSMLPISTYQVLNNLSPSLGTVTGVVRGNDGNIWMSDIDNDRVIEVSKSGSLVTGFMGSFLTEPTDVYANASSNAVSNVVASNVTSLNVLHSMYNQETGNLYVVFDNNLENIYASDTKLDTSKIYLRIGSHQIYFNDANFELMGVDETHYNLWSALSVSSLASVSGINNYQLTSHVLKIEPTGANRTLLDYLVDQKEPSIVIYTPLEQQKTASSVTVKFLTYNFDLGTESGEPSIRVTLDSGTPQIIYVPTVSYTGLSTGKHTIKAELLNASATPYSNIEATANSSFVVQSAYSLPYLYFTNPRPNQIYSSSPVTIEFVLNNFAIVPNGQHVRYQLDADSPVDYYSQSPVVISGVDPGKHSLTMYTVDQNGNTIVYPYGTATLEFIVGLNSNALTKLYVDQSAIYDNRKTVPCSVSRTYVDVGNVFMENIYSPMDVQIVLPVNDDPTLMVAKLRSPSWTYTMAGEANSIEYGKRIAISVANASNVVSNVVLNPALSSVPDGELIFGSKYLDGYSVVQLDLEGNVEFSDNHAKFANTKSQCVNILGSCERISSDEVLIGDAVNQRAIIVSTNASTQVSEVEWTFSSDRYVSDAHQIIQSDIEIDITNGAISDTDLYIRQGSVVIWKNNSASPISIYSGTTDYDTFYQDPDLDLYGDVFHSPTLQPGETYTFKFDTAMTIDYFVYSSILTAKINVMTQGVSGRDEYVILESDSLNSPFTSRVVKVDHYGNLIFSWGQSYLVQPRDARPLLSGNVLIST